MTRTRSGMVVLATAVLGLGVLSNGAAPRALAQAPGAGGDRAGAVSSLAGAARAMDGSLMEGVAVSARAVGKSITTSVFTDPHGEYVFPPLEGGQYEIWAQAVGYETARARVTV